MTNPGNKRKKLYRSIHFIVAGIGFGVLYWTLESIRDVVIFQKGTFLRSFFLPDPMGFWMRFLTVCILILFSVYAHHLTKARRKVEVELIKKKEKLEQKVKERTADIIKTNIFLTRENEERKIAENELRKVNRTLRTLSQSNISLVRATSESNLLKSVCKILTKMGGYRFAWVGITDENNGRKIQSVSKAGYDAGYLESVRFSYENRNGHRDPIGRAIRTGEPCFQDYTKNTAETAAWFVEGQKRGYKKSVSLPLLDDEQVFGTLNIYSTDVNAFDEEEMRLLKEMSYDLAFGIKVFQDRNNQEEMKEDLKRSEKKYRTLTENINVGIFRTTPGVKGRFVELNSALVRMFGYLNKKALFKISVTEVYQNPEDRKRLNQKMQKNGYVKNELIPLKRKDGTPLWGSITARAVKNKKGKNLYWDGIVEDVTEHKKADEALIRSEKRYRMIAENTTDVIWMLDMDMHVAYVSPSLERLLGYTPDEMETRLFEDLITKDSLEKIKKWCSEATSHRKRKLKQELCSTTLELEMIHKEKYNNITEMKATYLFNSEGKIIGIHGIMRDMTERRNAEKLIRETNARLEALVQAIPDVVYVKDAQGNNIIVNKAFENLVGRKQKDIIGKKDDELLPPDLAKACWISDSEALRMKKPLRYEEKVFGIDKDSIFFDTIKTPLFDKNGNAIGIIGVSRDITKRKRMDEEIERRKKYLESVLHYAPDAIVTLDASCKIMEWNPGAERIFGYSREEAIRKDIDALIGDPNQKNDPASLINCAISGKQMLPRETIRFRDDGSKVHVVVAASPIRMGDELHGMVAVYTDISEQKITEEKLLKLNQSLKTLSAGNMALVRATDEKILLNDVCNILVKIGGYEFAWVGFAQPEKDVNIHVAARAGRDKGYLNRIHLQLNETKQQSNPVAKAIGKSELTVCRYTSKKKQTGIWYQEGMKRKFASSISLPLSNHDEVFGALNIYSSDPNAFDNKEVDLLTEMATDLAFGIGVLRARIAHQKAESEKEKIQEQLLHAQKMEAVGILAGGIAHDFNNLLTAIIGCADLAMSEIHKKDVVYKDLGDIQVAAERAADLTRQLLLFSRKKSMKFSVVNINKTIRNLLKMLKRLIGENIQVVTKLENDLWTIRADRGTLEQIIMNLAINARDAMPEGGKLIVDTANIWLDEQQCDLIPESKPGKCVRLSVSDNGEGIDHDTVRHIFEPFFSTKGIGKGTGLGLSVVYGIVKEHGGWIQVVSNPGEGTTFHIYIPAVLEKHNEEKKVKVPVEKLQGRGRRILIVEDEERVREFTMNGLDRSGYVVFGASDAKEASTIFEEQKGNFNVILSDVVLPDKSGIEMVGEFLSHKPEIGVLFSSGYTDYQTRWPTIHEKGYRFLEKPYALNDLLRIIREVSA